MIFRKEKKKNYWLFLMILFTGNGRANCTRNESRTWTRILSNQSRCHLRTENRIFKWIKQKTFVQFSVITVNFQHLFCSLITRNWRKTKFICFLVIKLNYNVDSRLIFWILEPISQSLKRTGNKIYSFSVIQTTNKIRFDSRE